MHRDSANWFQSRPRSAHRSSNNNRYRESPVTALHEKAVIHKRRDLLTRRERDCLILSGKGLSEKEVAQHLDISPNTVRVHIENVKRKLAAANKSHAIVLSMLCGETDLSDFDEPGIEASI
jgi:DNA-binding CsgD family transcriptional regulator